MSRRTPDAAQSITSAPEPLAADQARRERRYLIQMGIRIVCFLLAVLLWQYVPMWVSLVLIVGAVVLPYTAVLFANAGRERRDAGPVPVLPPVLDAGPAATPWPAAPPAGPRAEAPVPPDEPVRPEQPIRPDDPADPDDETRDHPAGGPR
ncbi:DUF3099 domain-containing protein [Cellulomonas hominis]|uniref:DUF3099 domain-containing protein n=1 Tax=Cellulomonas hominis TaxID=156981 RepID=UPI001B9A60B6|nr:DUF3099 domain-containing protein [Cellulomonas hominis]VTR77774.1 hypothetical protein CHMI_02546 [Cellulomonas hominis]